MLSGFQVDKSKEACLFAAEKSVTNKQAFCIGYRLIIFIDLGTLNEKMYIYESIWQS
jgi:hypothetical protein